ncbi:MAG: hypothetical protein IKP04_02425 [Candidatus Methanomethylophilaceae archaeon]|nr:hypothetical protein [Candidatus Methanomethylophilaceae archaeon]
MTENKQHNITTGAAFGIAILLGIFIGINYGIMNGVFTILIVSGVYLSVSLYLKDKEENTGGPSELGAAITGGILLAGIGACGFVYSFTESVVITVVCLIAVMLLSSAILFSRYRKYL